jgi:predicted permease
MGVFAETLRALAPLFLLILLGAAARRAGLLTPGHIPIMNGLVVNITLPALVVINLADAPAVPATALWLPLTLFVCECVIAAGAYGLASALRSDGPRKGAALLVAAFGNTGFLGYPITLALFPRQFTINILADAIGMGMVLFTTAPLIGSILGDKARDAPGTDIEASATLSASPAIAGRGSRPSTAAPAPPPPRDTWTSFFRSPVFVAMVAGIAIRLLPWPDAVRHYAPLDAIGGVVGKCLGYLGQATVPLILLSLGASLRAGTRPTPTPSLKGRESTPLNGAPSIALACVFKLVLMPLLMWTLLRLLDIRGDTLTVGVMLAGMPSGVMSSVLSRYYNLDGDYAVEVVFITTVLSAFTLPIWILLAR